jgi:hypothetical protein
MGLGVWFGSSLKTKFVLGFRFFFQNLKLMIERPRIDLRTKRKSNLKIEIRQHYLTPMLGKIKTIIIIFEKTNCPTLVSTFLPFIH